MTKPKVVLYKPETGRESLVDVEINGIKLEGCTEAEFIYVGCVGKIRLSFHADFDIREHDDKRRPSPDS